MSEPEQRVAVIDSSDYCQRRITDLQSGRCRKLNCLLNLPLNAEFKTDCNLI
jgi:hypothetical protein